MTSLTIEARRAVLDKYARTRGGFPVWCTPSQQELRTGKRVAGWNTDGKVIFDSAQQATQAARELEALGSRPMRVYACPRSKHGHHHLASRRKDDDTR